MDIQSHFSFTSIITQVNMTNLPANCQRLLWIVYGTTLCLNKGLLVDLIIGSPLCRDGADNLIVHRAFFDCSWCSGVDAGVLALVDNHRDKEKVVGATSRLILFQEDHTKLPPVDCMWWYPKDTLKWTARAHPRFSQDIQYKSQAT